jgi:all-trans-retinol dehydrogenase (NAD+)
MSEIAGRHVLITGGASGIGRLMALEAAELGGRLTIWDINAQNLDKVVAELNARGRERAHGFICDVARRERVYAVADQTRAAAGGVDILINNAGVVSGRSLLEIPDEKIESTFAVNTLSLFWVTKAVLPDMLRRGQGHIVTIASASGLIGVAKLSDYAASKWAAVGFDESLRAELRQSAPGVRTTVVCPFYIDTGMFRGVKSRFPLLLPILQEDVVARRVIEAIRRNRPRLCMPPLIYLVPSMRLLPVRMMDWLAGFLGVNASMDEFKGRGGGGAEGQQRI